VTLLDEVMDAYGGSDRWARLQHFTFHASVDGALLARKGKRGALKDVVISGDTHDQRVSITGFTSPNKRASYWPHRVVIETLDGAVLEARDDPASAFDGHTDQTPWDDLHLAFFCGYAAWTGLTVPFLFARAGVRTEELDPWQQDGETWRRLKVIFPPDIVAHCPEQIFFFDRDGLQRRVDFQAIHAGGEQITYYTSAHQSFSGIVVATLRRALRLDSNGIAISRPAFVDVEIFDARFD